MAGIASILKIKGIILKANTSLTPVNNRKADKY